MGDVPASRSPPRLDGCAIARALPPATRLLLRGGPEALGAARGALGLADSDRPCRASSRGSRSALWLGPDERLLLADEGEGDALIVLLERTLAAMPHSLVDVSHALTGLEITGTAAATVLSTGCPLDLDAAAFPEGMCTRTVFAKAQIVLWRTGPGTFRLDVARSLGPYVSKLVALAARESATQDFGRSLAGS